MQEDKTEERRRNLIEDSLKTVKLAGVNIKNISNINADAVEVYFLALKGVSDLQISKVVRKIIEEGCEDEFITPAKLRKLCTTFSTYDGASRQEIIPDARQIEDPTQKPISGKEFLRRLAAKELNYIRLEAKPLESGHRITPELIKKGIAGGFKGLANLVDNLHKEDFQLEKQYKEYDSLDEQLQEEFLPAAEKIWRRQEQVQQTIQPLSQILDSLQKPRQSTIERK